MSIVDSQIHIWKEETPDRPWIPGARERMVLSDPVAELKGIMPGR